MSASEAKFILDETQTAEALGVSARTLQKWRQEGKGPKFVKLSRRRGYRPCDIEEFLAANVVTSTGESVA